MTSKKALESLTSQLAREMNTSLALEDKTITGEGRTRYSISKVVNYGGGFDPIDYLTDFTASELEKTLRFTLNILRITKENSPKKQE
jgi:hypothetical protein